MKKFIYSLFALALTAMTFSSCEDVPAPYNMPQEVVDDETGPTEDPSGTGTETDPYNVAAATQLGETLAVGQNTETVYVRGIVTTISIDTDFGNATYYISDDGTSAGQFYVYRGYSLGGARFTSTDEVKTGDEVIVCGVITNYNGTIEFTTGSKIVYLNGQVAGGSTTEGEGSGTAEDPYDVNKAMNLVNNGDHDPDAEVYIKGTVTSIDEISTSFGNASYYLSSDGGTVQMLIYRGYYFNGDKFTSEDQLKVGDELVICGKLVSWYGTPQVTQGSRVISQNGNTSGGSTEVGGKGTLESPYSAAQALSLIEAENYDADAEVYIKGIISEIKEVSASFGNATYWISDDGTTTNQLYVFRGYYLDGEKFTAEDQIKVGDEVVICGKLANYQGNSPQVNTGSKIVSLNGGDTGTTGNATISREGTTLTISDASATTASSISVNVADLATDDLANIALSDGTVISLAQEGGNNKPIYHANSGAFRMYALNSMTIKGVKKIASVAFTCESDRMGNDELYAEISGNTYRIVNHLSTGNSGGTQLRITAITINYAE